jgi:hypothetical protein
LARDSTVKNRDAVNPYPILHQLHRGIFLLRFVNYKPGTVKILADFSKRLTKMLPNIFPPVHMAYLESNNIDDEELSEIVASFSKMHFLRELYLIN